jgi:16S rRNA G966 N2-methylase RsmD
MTDHRRQDNYLFDTLALQYPDIGYLSYVTPHSVGLTVFKHLDSLIPLNQLAIWDVCAGIGTDSLRLSQLAGKVIATERDARVYECLVQNTAKNEKIVPYLGDCTTWLDKLQSAYDLAYFDPPWGANFQSGQPFELSKIRLGEQQVPVLEFLEQLRHNGPVLVKMPYYCYTLESRYTAEQILATLGFSQQKLKFMVLKPQSNSSLQ